MRMDLFLCQRSLHDTRVAYLPEHDTRVVGPVSHQRSWHDMRMDLFLRQRSWRDTRVVELFLRLNYLNEKRSGNCRKFLGVGLVAG